MRAGDLSMDDIQAEFFPLPEPARSSDLICPLRHLPQGLRYPLLVTYVSSPRTLHTRGYSSTRQRVLQHPSAPLGALQATAQPPSVHGTYLIVCEAIW